MVHGPATDSVRRSPDRPAPSLQADTVSRRHAFLRIFTLLATVPGILQTRASAAAIGPSTGRGFYKIVSYQVPPQHWQDFLAACKVNADASLREPGITGFELLLSKDAPNTVIAVEAYRNEAASQAHQRTAHFHAFVRTAQQLGVQRSVIQATRYYPA